MLGWYILRRRVWIWVKTMNNNHKVIFALFSFMHCFAQAMVQGFLFTLDLNANSRAADIVHAAQVPNNEVAWLTRHDGNFTLRLCKHVPVTAQNERSCQLIFSSGAGPIAVPPGFKRTFNISDAQEDVTIISPVVDQSGALGVEFTTSTVDDGASVFLNAQCTRVLLYASQVLKNSKREELALIGSEFWLLGISVFAIMYDSIPHLIAGFCFRLLSTTWSAYEIWRTRDIDTRFDALITHGPCGIDLFPGYFKQRIAIQIADVVLNTVALVLSGYLVRNLVLRYGSCMFKRVGAPSHLIKLYSVFLGVFVCLQMSVYLLVAATSLWIDQLINGTLVNISSHNTLYLIGFTFLNILLIPWITLGWFSVRFEYRRATGAFLVLGTAYVGGWSVLYYSEVFRWTWLQWPFFASFSVAAQAVQLASVVLGFACWRNYGQGLKQYLNVDHALARADFEPEVFPHNVEGPRGQEKRQMYEVDFREISIDADSVKDGNFVEEFDMRILPSLDRAHGIDA